MQNGVIVRAVCLHNLFLPCEGRLWTVAAVLHGHQLFQLILIVYVYAAHLQLWGHLKCPKPEILLAPSSYRVYLLCSNIVGSWPLFTWCSSLPRDLRNELTDSYLCAGISAADIQAEGGAHADAPSLPCQPEQHHRRAQQHPCIYHSECLSKT